MKIILIAAIGKNNELGKGNDLIWRIPEDMKFFKNTTIGNTILMGRKTFESLPGLLKDRKHIVLSKSNDFPNEVIVYSSIDDFMNDYKNREEDVYVIGGGSIYRLFIDVCDEMYLTEIDDSRDADVYFPEFDKSDFDINVLSEHIYESDNESISYKHVHYLRKK